MTCRTTTAITLAFTSLSFLCTAIAGEPEIIKIRPTQADLAKRTTQRTNPLEKHKSVTSLAGQSIEKKKTRQDLGGLLDRSTMLSQGGYWTLVPKGSVLHVPALYQSRVSDKPTGKLIPWADFYARNRGWILTQPVEMEIARGERRLLTEVIENHQQCGRVVVAVLHNGPISVMPPQVSSDEEATPQSQP